MKNLIISMVGLVGTLTGAGVENKADNEVYKADRATCKDSLRVALKSLTTEPIVKSEQLPCINTPCDSVFYFEKGKIEGLSLCPKLHEKAFHKLNMTVTSNGHMVLDRANNRYMIPIKNGNPDSINMLNDSLEEPFSVPKGEIKIKPGK